MAPPWDKVRVNYKIKSWFYGQPANQKSGVLVASDQWSSMSLSSTTSLMSSDWLSEPYRSGYAKCSSMWPPRICLKEIVQWWIKVKQAEKVRTDDLDLLLKILLLLSHKSPKKPPPRTNPKSPSCLWKKILISKITREHRWIGASEVHAKEGFPSVNPKFDRKRCIREINSWWILHLSYTGNRY